MMETQYQHIAILQEYEHKSFIQPVTFNLTLANSLWLHICRRWLINSQHRGPEFDISLFYLLDNTVSPNQNTVVTQQLHNWYNELNIAVNLQLLQITKNLHSDNYTHKTIHSTVSHNYHSSIGKSKKISDFRTDTQDGDITEKQIIRNAQDRYIEQLTDTDIIYLQSEQVVPDTSEKGMCSSMANPTVASATAAAQGVLTPMPCVPNTTAPWAPGSPTVIYGNFPALNNSSKLMYMWGGVISVTSPGQVTTNVP